MILEFWLLGFWNEGGIQRGGDFPSLWVARRAIGLELLGPPTSNSRLEAGLPTAGQETGFKQRIS